MTSTSYNIGVGDLKRPTSKVLKPPGGGSSDIFGGADTAQPERHIKNYNKSSLAFGDSDSTSTAPMKAGLSDASVKSGLSEASPSSENESNGKKAEEQESSANTVSSEPSQPDPAPQPPNPAPARQRVPPGGFSSGLW